MSKREETLTILRCTSLGSKYATWTGVGHKHGPCLLTQQTETCKRLREGVKGRCNRLSLNLTCKPQTKRLRVQAGAAVGQGQAV